MLAAQTTHRPNATDGGQSCAFDTYVDAIRTYLETLRSKGIVHAVFFRPPLALQRAVELIQSDKDHPRVHMLPAKIGFQFYEFE
jgi:hypothetical protein